MSSEFDEFFSFEKYLQDDGLDGALVGNDLNSLDDDAQEMRDGDADFQMLGFPDGDFDSVVGEALDGSSAVASLDWSPWTGDVASAANPEEPGEFSDAFSAPSLSLIGGAILQADQSPEACRRTQMDEILHQWPGVTKCPWPNCSSKATFKFRNTLKTHIFNVHVTQLVCGQPNCSYRKPFSKQYELNRHMATAHGTTRDHKCPIDACEASIAGFSRKDKLIKHLREEHENLRCPFIHCSATVLVEEAENHVSQSHGDYECALQGCEYGGPSRFTVKTIERHLRRDHSLDYDATERLLLDLRNTKMPIVSWQATSRRKVANACNICLGNVIKEPQETGKVVEVEKQRDLSL